MLIKMPFWKKQAESRNGGQKSFCADDVKKALKAVELYLQQSGLYYESTNNGENNSRKYNPNTMSSNSFKDSLMKPVNGNMENNGKK